MYRKILIIIPVYILCWLVMYVFINQDLNIALAFEYFIQAWSFNGFVKPMSIWWLSNILFIVAVIIKRRGANE